MSLPLLLVIASALLLVFALGLRAGVHDATYLFRRPAELLRAFLAMNVLMRLFAIAFISIFDFNPAVKIAIVALSQCAIKRCLQGRRRLNAAVFEEARYGLELSLVRIRFIKPLYNIRSNLFLL